MYFDEVVVVPADMVPAVGEILLAVAGILLAVVDILLVADHILLAAVVFLEEAFDREMAWTDCDNCGPSHRGRDWTVTCLCLEVGGDEGATSATSRTSEICRCQA